MARPSPAAGEDDHDLSQQAPDAPEQRSRTALAKDRKAAEKRLAALAAALVKLAPKQLARLQLPEELVEAVEEGRRMKAHGARARQLRIVRRELRNSDSDAIAAEVEALLNPHGSPTVAERDARRWLDRLLAEGDTALDALPAAGDPTDRQHLRRLLRNARSPKKQQAAKAKKTLLALLAESLRHSKDEPPT